MKKNILTEHEEKILVLILLSQGSVGEKTAQEVLGWSDEVFNKTRASLVLKGLIHNLTKDLQFGKGGNTEALKISIKRHFPLLDDGK